MTAKMRTRPGLLLMESPESPAQRAAEKRRIRKHQILDTIRKSGPISRVDIARALGFNLPTVSSLVDELVGDGLALEDEAKKTAIGRRPIPVSLNAQAASVMGIDVGKTRTIGLIMNLGGTILGRVEQESPLFGRPEEQARWIEQVATELLSQYSGAIPPLAGVGVALPGLIYRPQSSMQILEPEAEAIRDLLVGRLHVPVLVHNDARMMALGILWFGRTPDLPANFVTINVGLGLGMGVVAENSLYHGGFGHAGEIGHLPLGEPGIACYCGGKACLENTASGAGLERLAARAGITREGRRATTPELAQMARAGDKRAIAVFEKFSMGLAAGIGSVMCLINPATVILAGRVVRCADVFMPKLLEELKTTTIGGLVNETRIEVSELAENAGPLGTCACVLHHIFSTAHISAASVV